MNETVMSTSVRVSDASCDPATRVTKSLLGYGVIAGPLYVAVVLIQALIRPGFDLVRDDVSLLSNGTLGWIQIANFAVTGLMVVACSIGIRRALAGGLASTWAPRLLGLYGVGLIAAGIFVADPMNGFPPGTPAGRPSTISLHGTLHIAAAAIGFLGLIAACFILARRFAALDQRRWAIFSRATGILFFAGFVGVASGSSSPVVVLGFWLALLVAWGWLAAVSVHLYRQVAAQTAGI
ncbi:MAG TPA: DUF998 domain-containing protein [Chloroflexota bacterium]